MSKNNLENISKENEVQDLNLKFLKNIVKRPQLYYAIGKYAWGLFLINAGEKHFALSDYIGLASVTSGMLDFMAASVRSMMPKDEGHKEFFGNLPAEGYMTRATYKILKEYKSKN